MEYILNYRRATFQRKLSDSNSNVILYLRTTWLTKNEYLYFTTTGSKYQTTLKYYDKTHAYIHTYIQKYKKNINK